MKGNLFYFRTTKRPGLVERHALQPLRWSAVVFCSLAVAAKSSAQTSSLPSSSFSSSTLAGTSQLGSFSPPFASPFFDNISLLQWGPVHVRPHFVYRYSATEGLQSAPGQTQTTAIQEFVPSVELEWGHWSLNYTPSFRFYSDNNFEDSIDHSLNLSARTTYEDWSINFSQGYSFSFTPLVETGGQTKQQSFATAFGVSRELSSQLSLDIGLNQGLNFIEQSGGNTQSLVDARSWSTLDWLNYKVWPRLNVGVGAGLSYSHPSDGVDSTSEQLLGRVSWIAGEKLTLSFNTGIDVRQSLGSDRTSLINPVFGLSAQYRIFEQTSLSVNASRAVTDSYFKNQVTENTTVGISLSQRLLEHLSLDMNVGYGVTSYRALVNNLSVNREDENINYGVRLTMPIRKHMTVSVFYQLSQNASQQSAFSTSTRGFGLEASYSF